MGKKFQAFIDGYNTGADLLGTIIGHATGARTFGYIADKYSMFNRYNKIQEPPIDYIIMFDDKSPPKSRSLEEQVIKGIGDSTGLISNVIFFLPQIGLLGLVSLGHGYEKVNNIFDKLYRKYFAKQRELPFK